MGYGIPASLAAKFARPESTVICVAGDGDFQMTGTELATAVAHGPNIRVLILNNGMLGTTRMHKERNYPGRVSGTPLAEGNPDFTAFARADAHEGPAVLEIMIDPEMLTPAMTLSQIRAAAVEAAQ
ncbi:thiamine pyrophosphate-dependent enzyme [Frigidibacter sp. ROC022]|uniref:thiamine pyrophosphate-dependent enzyme n=1 Tax=Frigidibacter sp. ROC022 TaxID=2971796 RepID=UPI003082CBD7